MCLVEQLPGRMLTLLQVGKENSFYYRAVDKKQEAADCHSVSDSVATYRKWASKDRKCLFFNNSFVTQMMLEQALKSYMPELEFQGDFLLWYYLGSLDLLGARPYS